MTTGRRVSMAVMAIVALALPAGCGRSAPEGATPAPDDGEPVTAGVQVVSEQQVFVPPPTTATIPTTVTTPAPTPAGTYVVQPGDTLSRIAGQFGISIQALSDANGITDVNAIQPGQELMIPASG